MSMCSEADRQLCELHVYMPDRLWVSRYGSAAWGVQDQVQMFVFVNLCVCVLYMHTHYIGE